jgi:hypothetical protein
VGLTTSKLDLTSHAPRRAAKPGLQSFTVVRFVGFRLGIAPPKISLGCSHFLSTESAKSALSVDGDERAFAATSLAILRSAANAMTTRLHNEGSIGDAGNAAASVHAEILSARISSDAGIRGRRCRRRARRGVDNRARRVDLDADEPRRRAGERVRRRTR